MKVQLFLSVGLVLMFSACSKDNNADLQPTAATESISTVAKKQSVPIKGAINYNFVINYDMPCDCGSYYPVGTLYGEGNLSHLGKTSSYIKPCVAPIITDGSHIGDHVGVECGSFVAANGDEVYLYTYPYDLIYTPMGAIGYLKADVVGGTGRFANATGSVTGKVTVLTTSASFSDINGTINY